MKPDEHEQVPTSVLGLKSKTPETMTSTKKIWNTEKLGLRLSSDLLSAASAASLVAPIISIIDRYVLCLSHP